MLWKFIKSEQLSGLKFRRQFSVGNYILDFYCAEFRLAIELDGNYHFSEEGIIKDQIRDEFLQKLNITVLRIENELVLTRMETVLGLILEKIEQLKTPPSR